MSDQAAENGGFETGAKAGSQKQREEPRQEKDNPERAQ